MSGWEESGLRAERSVRRLLLGFQQGEGDCTKTMAPMWEEADAAVDFWESRSTGLGWETRAVSDEAEAGCGCISVQYSHFTEIHTSSAPVHSVSNTVRKGRVLTT